MDNLIVPHPESVLDQKLNQYHPELYLKLATMESFCYSEGVNGSIGNYKPIFIDYNAAWLEYFNAIRISAVDAKDLFLGFYAFTVVHIGYGRGSASTYNDADAWAVFDAGGLIDQILQAPINYYDDFIIVPPDPSIVPPPLPLEHSPRVDAAISTLASAPGQGLQRLENLVDTRFPSPIQDHAIQAILYGIDNPQEVVNPSTLWEHFFIICHWKAYIEATGTPFAIPPKPAAPPPPPVEPEPEPEPEPTPSPSLDGRFN